MNYIVFVSGTLRNGGVRAIPELFLDAEFVGFGVVKGWLYDFGAYPSFVADPHGLDILGEVYQVSEEAVRAMDVIERYEARDEANSYYLRRHRTVLLRDGNRVEAMLYECNPRLYDCTVPLDVCDWMSFAQAKGELPPEAWSGGAPIKR